MSSHPAARPVTMAPHGARRVGVGVAALLLGASTVVAHPPKRGAPPDLVRLQGYRAAQPAEGQRTMRVTVNGREEPFQLVDLRRFSLVDTGTLAEPDLDRPYFLQGSPAVVSRFGRARPEQRITILAQWRPGRRDLFVLALDLCPET